MTQIFEHGYAVVIGVHANNIQRLALPTVAKDVQAVFDVLVHPERCAYEHDHVKLLKGEDSTKTEIMEALYWLQDKVKADDEATAVLYYSGHGMVDKVTDEYYLIPYDIKALSRIRADAIKAQTLTAEISSIKAKRMLVILDCCHAEGMDIKDVDLSAIENGAEVAVAAFPIDLPATKDIPEYMAVPGSKDVSGLADGNGRAILNSSTGAQSSYVRRDGKMSLFTYHLIEALTGHAPHADDATVVYVTDVMSWVTHEVKKSAISEGVSQTPVMRTSGVFPVAQLIGGQGVAKGLGGTPPNPLEPLPAPSVSIQVDHAEGAVIAGGVDTGGGDLAGRDIHKGDVHHGDVVHGDKVDGDKVGGDKITVGNISSSSGVAIGRGASAAVTTHHDGGASLGPLFAPLQTIVAQQNPALSSKVDELKAQVERGAGADDSQMANLIQDIADGVPAAKSTLVAVFKNPAVAAVGGGNTQFVLGRLG